MYAIDRISNLPSNITDHILHFLPLKDAVKTSILSTHWRYEWIRLPQLILDRSFVSSIPKFNRYSNDSFPCQTLNVGMLEFLSIVNSILLRHDEPIHNFVLEFPFWFTKDTDITHWILFLSRNLVREFTLLECNYRRRKLPSQMFSSMEFNHLTHLTLINRSLPSVSTTFRGFPCLLSLKLRLDGCSIDEANKLGFVVSKCPLLESLDLTIFDAKGCLTIRAPKLQNMVVVGHLSSVCLEETQRIKILTVDVVLDHKRDMMIDFFSCLPLVEKLNVGCRFWENYLDEAEAEVEAEARHPLEKLNNNIAGKFRELKNLVLDGLHLNSQWNISYLFRFLNMAPNLEFLNIGVVNGDKRAANDVTVVGADCSLDHLKSAKIKCDWLIQKDGCTLQLLKMLLSSSPVLEVMTIKVEFIDHEKFITEELLRHHRASANVEIFLNQTQLH